jgi:hypothetical protein
MLPSGQKQTLGLLTTITLEVVPFHVYAWFPALLNFLKCVLEVVFREGVQHCCNSASVTSTVSQWWPFGFILNRGNRKVERGMTVMLFLVKTNMVKKKI